MVNPTDVTIVDDTNRFLNNRTVEPMPAGHTDRPLTLTNYVMGSGEVLDAGNNFILNTAYSALSGSGGEGLIDNNSSI